MQTQWNPNKDSMEKKFRKKERRIQIASGYLSTTQIALNGILSTASANKLCTYIPTVART